MGRALRADKVAEAASRRPNFVLILIDDMGWKDYGAAGSGYYQTPNIDKLAADGMFFDRGYSAAPVCSPSRGAILSGKAPARTKLTNVFSGGVDAEGGLHEVSKPGNVPKNGQYFEGLHRYVLPREEVTIAEALGEAGYETGYYGKWHCGWHENFSPLEQGFEHAEGFRLTPSGTNGHLGKRFIGRVQGMADLKPEEDMADALTARATGFMRDNKDKSFFLMLSHFAVHSPLEGLQEVVEKYKNLPATDHNNPIYAAMVESVDRSVGKVVETLRELGIEDNTVVFFTSDNGGLSKNTSNYPLLGGKSFCYEAGTRVPFIVKWPHVVEAGTTESTPVIGMDLYPTMLNAAGLPMRPEQHRDGASILPLLTGAAPIKERALYFHFPHYTHAVGPYASIIDKEWKLIRFYNTSSGEFQLFNLNKDPYEQNDLSPKMPEKVKQLVQKLEAWQKDANAEMPRRNQKYDPSKQSTKDMEFTHNLAQKERNIMKARLDKKSRE